MNIKNIFKNTEGLYFINAKKNSIIESVLEIKKETVKKENLKIFAIGFKGSNISKISQFNETEEGSVINFLTHDEDLLEYDYNITKKLDYDVILINLKKVNNEDALNIIKLFESGHKVIVLSENKFNKEDFLNIYKQKTEITKLNLIYEIKN